MTDQPVAPGWYPDPEGSDGERWWDGSKWGASVLPKLTAPSKSLASEDLPNVRFTPASKKEEVVEEIVPAEGPGEELSDTSTADELIQDSPLLARASELAEDQNETIEESSEEDSDLDENLTPVSEARESESATETASSEADNKPKREERVSGEKNKQVFKALAWLTLIVFLVVAAAVFFLQANGESPEPQVTPTVSSSSTPSASESAEPAEPTATASEVLEKPSDAYPDYVKTNFMNSCEPGADGQTAVCECIFTTIQNEYSFEKFTKLDAISSKSEDSWSKKEKKDVERLKTITNDCVLKYYNVTG